MLTNQVLLVDPPNELRFCGPFTEPVTANMKLMNTSDVRMCFKIKTTAPKRYCVKPNSGFVEANEVVNIAVILQPFDYDPAEKNKHKFMVQSMFAPGKEINHEAVWKGINPEHLMDTKLKCVFELPIDSASPQNNIDTNVTHEETVEKVDIIKSSPKVSNVGAELKKALDEVKQLREEESCLRQENLELKEKVMKMQLMITQLQSSVSTGTLSVTPIAPPPTTPAVYTAVAMFVGLIGIIVGKFFL